MPPEPEVSNDFIFNGLKNADIFDNKGNLKKQSDPIWESICKNLSLKMQPKSLHLYVYNDRNNCKTNLLEYKGFSLLKASKIKKKSEEFFIYKNNNPKGCKPLDFELKFSQEEWLKIKPYKQKNKTKLKRGWTDIFYQKIWSEQKLPCAYNFKNLYVSNTSDSDTLNVYFSGYCSDCKTSLYGELCKKEFIPNEDEVYIFEIKTYATHNIKHSRKRKLAGETRKDAKKILLYKYATDYKEDLRNELMDCSYEPAHLNSTAVYEKARQEVNNENIHYKPFMEITSSWIINKCGIRKISWQPFYIFYWTDEQVQLWNKIAQLNLPLSMDATGGVVKKEKFMSFKSKTIFFYVIVVGIGRKIVPLWQFLSSIHHVGVIEEALSTWVVKSGAKVPMEIVTDGSSALQNAITLSFNRLTFSEYNLKCYQYLLKKSTDLPNCFYRCDIAHLLNTLNYWKCFKSTQKDIIQFYKRCIGYMSQLKTLSEFKTMTISVLTISMSEIAPENSKCNTTLKFVTNVLRTYNLPDEESTGAKEKVFEMPEDESGKLKNELSNFITEIFIEAQSLILFNQKITDKPNFYHVKGFEKNFLTLCEKFPSWTNIMLDSYKSNNVAASSARSEAFFCKKKRQIPKPLSAIKFILKDVEKAESLVKYGLSALKNESKYNNVKECRISVDLFDIQTETDEIEKYKNWKRMILQSNETEGSFENENINCTNNGSNEENILINSVDANDLLKFSYNESNEKILLMNSIDANDSLKFSCNRSNEKNILMGSMNENGSLKFNYNGSNEKSISMNSANANISLEINYNGIVNSTPQKNELSAQEISLENSSLSCEKLNKDDISLLDTNDILQRKIINNGLSVTRMTYIINESKKELKFINTCAFDSITEIFVSVINNSVKFKRNILNSHRNNKMDYLKAVTSYAQTFDLYELYNNRAAFLYPLFNEVIGVVNCRANVISLFESLIALYPSIIENIQCCCGNANKKALYTRSISSKDFFSDGVRNLEKSLNDALQDRVVQCHICFRNTALVNYEMYDYIAIDLEYFHETKNYKMFQKYLKKNVTSVKTNLQELPTTLCIKGKLYSLHGVIEFREPLFQNGIAHYIAYSRSISDNEWKMYDDLSNDVTVIKDHLPILKIAMIIYIMN